MTNKKLKKLSSTVCIALAVGIFATSATYFIKKRETKSVNVQSLCLAVGCDEGIAVSGKRGFPLPFIQYNTVIGSQVYAGQSNSTYSWVNAAGNTGIYAMLYYGAINLLKKVRIVV